jgi:hypothetical protein
MKTRAMILVGLLGSLCAASAAPAGAGGPTLLGYLDAQTGAFRPLMSIAEAAEVPGATATEETGELKIAGTITLESPSITATTPISCSATAVIVADPEGVITESATSPATHSGSTATCSVLIPYEWLLLTPTTDSVTLSVTVSAISADPRAHSQQLATFKVPANTATTSFTFATRL